MRLPCLPRLPLLGGLFRRGTVASSGALAAPIPRLTYSSSSFCAPIDAAPKAFSSISFARSGMAAFLPKTVGNFERINFALFPPLAFVACGVDVVVVDGAKRHGELIADL